MPAKKKLTRRKTAVKASKKTKKIKARSRRLEGTVGRQLSTSLQVEELDKPKSTVVITLKDFLQRYEANEITMTVDALREDGVKAILFDLAKVKYANSSAIGAFVNSASTLKAKGGQVVLFAMPPNIRKVFDTLGLANLFVIVETREIALKSLS